MLSYCWPVQLGTGEQIDHDLVVEEVDDQDSDAFFDFLDGEVDFGWYFIMQYSNRMLFTKFSKLFQDVSAHIFMIFLLRLLEDFVESGYFLPWFQDFNEIGLTLTSGWYERIDLIDDIWFHILLRVFKRRNLWRRINGLGLGFSLDLISGGFSDRPQTVDWRDIGGVGGGEIVGSDEGVEGYHL